MAWPGSPPRSTASTPAHDVTLLEARPTLGGAVQTLPERDGDPPPPPDNGQHVALGCFTEYLRFLERIGQTSSIRRLRLELPVIDENGRVGALGPGPLHAASVPAPATRRAPPPCRDSAPGWGVSIRPHTTARRSAALLRRLGSSERAIDRFWDVFIRPALNLPADEASASLGLFTVQTALLADRAASDLVLPSRSAGRDARRRGGPGARGGGRDGDGQDAGRRARARCGCDGRRRARRRRCVRRRRASRRGRVPARASRRPPLEDSPIVSVHLLFDRSLLEPPLAALLGSPAHWIFDRGRLTGHPPERGQYLTVVSSGVPDLVATRGRELVELMRAAIVERLGPAELLWSRVSREPQATFAGRPGTAAHRPGPETGRPGVVRAGAWTRTGWPATMEGAVRSGRTAARTLLGSAIREPVTP